MIVKRVTEKARFPGSTLKGSPLERQAMAAMVQATPMPRKTLTALEPVTLPMEASAYWSWMAATLLANVSRTKVKNSPLKTLSFLTWLYKTLSSNCSVQIRLHHKSNNQITYKSDSDLLADVINAVKRRT